MFNGIPGAHVVAICAIEGAREFVQGIKGRFPLVQFVGLADDWKGRSELCDCGCCCVTSSSHLPLTLPAILEKRWRYDPAAGISR